MIEINLLPKELRRKEKLKFPKEFYIITLSALGFLIILYSVTGVLFKWKNYRLVKLSRNWVNLAPLKKEADIIKRELADLNQRVGGIDRLMVKRFLWSKKLNQLSDLLASGIWLRELSLSSLVSQSGDLLPVLTLKGSVVSPSGEEMAVVGRFMTNLKNSESFSGDFENIELKSIQRREIKGTEIADFVLVCHFKEGVL